MKLLIIGGTRFLGRALVDAALTANHEVTLFNRGLTNVDLYPQLEQFRGDRDGGLHVLKGRHWDAVIDTCGYVPRLVRDSAELLADTVSDTLAWLATRPAEHEWRGGLSAVREAALLQAWRQGN